MCEVLTAQSLEVSPGRQGQTGKKIVCRVTHGGLQAMLRQRTFGTLFGKQFCLGLWFLLAVLLHRLDRSSADLEASLTNIG